MKKELHKISNKEDFIIVINALELAIKEGILRQFNDKIS